MSDLQHIESTLIILKEQDGIPRRTAKSALFGVVLCMLVLAFVAEHAIRVGLSVRRIE